MEDIKACPWENGYYKLPSMSMVIFKVNGESVKMETIDGEIDDSLGAGSWTFGEFGETHTEVAKDTGKKYSNVDIRLWGGMWNSKGVLSDDGKKITLFSTTNEVDSFVKMSDEDYAAFRDRADLADAPSNHYKIQPEFQGKLLWVSGAPGLGKSTTGLYLSRTADYVYYEADAFLWNANPYVPPDVDEADLATMRFKPLKGVPQDRIDAVNKSTKDFVKLIKVEEYDIEGVKGFYTAMCKDIMSERKRIGGNWVVVQAVPTRILRDHVKKELGPNLNFVVLNMSKEEQLKRVKARHGEEGAINDMLIKVCDIYERATNDEENAINIDVTSDMTREDVVKAILHSLPR